MGIHRKDETVATSETGASKGQKLEQYGLIPADALAAVAERYGLGAEKYDPPDQWINGYDFRWAFDAAQRHLWAFWSGEDIDPDATLSKPTTHLAAAAFHVFSLLHFSLNPERYGQYDDRPKEEA